MLRERIATQDDRLVAAGWLFAAGSTIHVIDHLRRGQGSVSEGLYWLGNLGLVLQVVTVTLVVTRHRLAPAVAVSAGIPLAIGFTAAHWLPTWSPLSDPVWEIEVAAWFSAFASGAEILGAALVAVLGVLVLRERGIESLLGDGAGPGVRPSRRPASGPCPSTPSRRG